MIKKTDSLHVLHDGDSLTQGTDGRGTQDRAMRINSLMIHNGFTDVTYASYGIAGRTTKELIAEWDTKVKPYISTTRTNILVIMEDVNAILNWETKGALGAKTGRENYEDMAQYIAQAREDGIDYVVLTTGFYPFLVGGSYNQAWWTEDRLLMQKEYFDMVHGLGMSGADALVDLRRHPILGGGRGQTYDPNYMDDSVHALGIGYDKLGDFEYKNGILKLVG